ncbi:MAG TPA: prepilin-type N-terminal cleavage/methylation domain-containing protein [Polyangiales bacterium]|nr:prepilin-type N-terminal cleavage/methylation domain-containing protein [Polyangiales bacterium]
MTRTARRLRRRGMTLIEIMIVVVIMALVATGVGMAVMPAFTRSQVKVTLTAVQNVRSAAIAYHVAGHPECPTVEALREERMLDRQTASTDAWSHGFVIDCANDDVVVRSAGPDGIHGTDDDIPDHS